ncbi:MAG: response regulator transcription factor [bacterium]|nr:response regulator transcription factor [Gammaproteobacteria bacterium]HIL96075.1 response regulator transcription factor [Pseudomonadales bacterium]
MKVLVIEDDPRIMALLKAYFETKGHFVITAGDGVDGLSSFNEDSPDLVLLDIGLPKLDGWSVLEVIRSANIVPIVLLTALDDTESVVKGLALGADDYLIKPFDVRVLDARIRAIMRRIEKSDEYTNLEVGRIRIDDRGKRVTVGNATLALSPKEFSLLKLLASEPGRVFSSNEIIAHLWPDNDRAAASDVKQYIHLLRNKLEEKTQIKDSIENIKGFGYRLLG